MSGHSKWNNIKHKKEKSDAQKAKIFTKMGREIAVAAKSGGSDPEVNGRLKDAIAKARSFNMPNDNIAREIKKAAGEQNMDNYEDISYEGYGPKGVAVIVETLTDNRNRTAGDLRHYFDKFGGNLGTNGSVSWMFEQKGIIIVNKDDSVDEDELTMDALDAGADDFGVEDEFYEIRDMNVGFGLPISFEGVTVEDVVAATKKDKKMEADKIKFVLLKKLGHACLVTDVTDAEMLEAIKTLHVDWM